MKNLFVILKASMRSERPGPSLTSCWRKVSGCLLVCLNRATRLVKAQQSAGKECALETLNHHSQDRYKENPLKVFSGHGFGADRFWCSNFL